MPSPAWPKWLNSNNRGQSNDEVQNRCDRVWRIRALCDAQQFGLIHSPDVNALCQRPDIDLVYIASPPFLHYSHAMAALSADKYVVVEKPLALSLSEADDMLALARIEDRIVVANLMQRYNPLADQVGELIQKAILGKPLHGYFENYASDEQLGTDHWFGTHPRAEASSSNTACISLTCLQAGSAMAKSSRHSDRCASR